MKNNYTPFNPPAKFWSKSWQPMVQLILNGLAKSSIVIVSYYLIKNLTKQIKLDEQIDFIVIVELAIIALFVLLLRVHERYTSEKMSQKYINRIRSSLLKRIMRASLWEIQSQSIGNLSSRLAGDLNSIKRWFSLGVSRLITHSLLLIVTLGLIFKINTYLGFSILISVLGLISLSVIIGNKLKYSIKNVRNNRIKIHSLLVEKLSSLSTIRAMGKEQYEVKKINRQATKLEKNISRQGIYLGLLRGIGNASALVLISVFFSFQYFMHNQLSIEQITALISIILFLNSPIRELGRVQEYYQGAKLSISKIQQLYKIPRIIRGKSNQQSSHNPNLSHIGKITINSLSYSNIFKNLNLKAQTGEHIALTGKNGSGKSSLIQLLLGHVSANSGTLSINGINPLFTNSKYRSDNIGVSGVNLNIMKGTLLENLTYRSPTYDTSEFDDLLKTCQLDTLVNQLPLGLATKVKEFGANFSSGEVARISLFRALLGHPHILILDEPESYLDEQGLTIIKTLLQGYKGTTIIATHNTELKSLCDKRWQLKNLDKSIPELTTKNPIKLVHENESK